jgi:hypothetical protein
VDQIGGLDLDALTKASATAADFEKALGELGTCQPLYRTDQTVRLSGDTITVGSQSPYVVSQQVTNRGQTINTVGYTQTGATFNLAGKIDRPDSIELDLGIQVSTMSEGVAITSKANAPLYRNVQMVHKAIVTVRQPFVVISADGASRDGADKAIVYIARVTLGAPQSGD